MLPNSVPNMLTKALCVHDILQSLQGVLIVKQPNQPPIQVPSHFTLVTCWHRHCVLTWPNPADSPRSLIIQYTKSTAHTLYSYNADTTTLYLTWPDLAERFQESWLCSKQIPTPPNFTLNMLTKAITCWQKHDVCMTSCRQFRSLKFAATKSNTLTLPQTSPFSNMLTPPLCTTWQLAERLEES